VSNADFSISVNADLQKILAAMQARGQSIDKARPVIAEMMLSAVADVFDAQGPGWAPLAASTVAKRRGVTHMILQDSGVMAASGAPAYGSDFVDVVFGVPYAVYHTSDAPRTRLPRRDFTDLGPFEQPLLDDVAAYLATVIS
jgi:phage gpG-like protein